MWRNKSEHSLPTNFGCGDVPGTMFCLLTNLPFGGNQIRQNLFEDAQSTRSAFTILSQQGDVLDLRHVQPKFPFGGGQKVNVFGVIGAPLKIPFITVYDGNLTGDAYKRIVRKCMKEFKDLPRPLYWVQDGARPHVPVKIEPILARHHIKMIVLPPCSPDINIIENTWKVLKDNLRSERITRNELVEMIPARWKALSNKNW